MCNNLFGGEGFNQPTSYVESQSVSDAGINGLPTAAFTTTRMKKQDDGQTSSVQNFAKLPPHIHAALLNASQQLESQRASGMNQYVAGGSETMIPGPRFFPPSPQSLSTHPIQYSQAPSYQNHIRPLNAHVDIAHQYGHQLQVPYLSAPPGPGYSYGYAPRTQFGDQQSDPIRRVQIQINYLDAMSLDIPTQDDLVGEVEKKEDFRLRLIQIAQAAIEEEAKARGLEAEPKAVELRCFGSSRNGFALPGSDMDLATITHSAKFPDELHADCPLILTKAFLEAGLGALLIDKARVPIIKLCEKPPDTILGDLKAEFHNREKETISPSSQQEKKFANDSVIETEPRNTRFRTFVFPKSGSGIQCDVSFSSRLALYNSELLRCYSLCDDRVRSVGLFVKQWAKARDINNPYHGTLCSYGYLLMVVHYLTNVVDPPVTPNLQRLYHPPPPDGQRRETTIVDGCDVRFFRDEHEIRSRIRSRTWAGNRQSVGELLRGFFWYYASSGSNAPRGGFNWTQSVLSIRTHGGILTKAEKGWTKIRVDEQGIKHNFLLAIEDPFEWNHNVGRTVRSAGIQTVREEFRRATMIISRIQEIPGAGWQWRTDAGEVGEHLFAKVSDRPLPRRNFPRYSRRVPNETSSSKYRQTNDNPGQSASLSLHSTTKPSAEQRGRQMLSDKRDHRQLDWLAGTVEKLTLERKQPI